MPTGADGAKLTPDDLARHAALGIDAALLDRAGVRRVSDGEAREVLSVNGKSGDYAGIEYPYIDPRTGQRVTSRVRRDHPSLDADGRPRDKYRSPYGDNRHLYFAPGAAALLADIEAPVVLVEAEKSALAVNAAATRTERRALPIALGGCWGWRGVIGKGTDATGARVDVKGPLSDLGRVTWTGRDTIIAFDSNAATNTKVQAAHRALAAELEKRGTMVRIVELPSEDGINGPDDYIGRHGAAAWWALVDAARPLVDKTPTKAKPAKPKQGRDVQFEEPEPWPHPVDGATLLDAIAATFDTYLTLPTHAGIALALWVLHAYAHAASFITPCLAVTSPEKRCGKTLLLIILGALVPRRMFASNVTPAVLFRAIEKYQPTLLIDEADTFVRDNDELRGVLNSGHTRTTAVVIRAVGNDHDPRTFSTWCPKAIALIGTLPGTLSDRSIEIKMRRRTARERRVRLRHDRIDADCGSLRQQALRWADDVLDRLKAADPDVPEALHDRAADCWRPLLAIADAAGGTWPALAREAAAALSGTPDEEAATTRLLRDIRDVFAEAADPEAMASSIIIEKLVALADRPWKEWSQGRPLSGAKMAHMLKGYDVLPAGSIRVGEKSARAYRRIAFVDAWDRYLHDDDLPSRGEVEACQRDHANKSADLSRFSNRDTGSGCHALQSVTDRMNTDASHAVTDLDPHSEEFTI